MTATELLAYAVTDEQAAAVLRCAHAADRDLGAETRAIAYRLDADYGVGMGHVTLEAGGYSNVVLEDGTITGEIPS